MTATYSLNEAILHLNLAGHSNVVLKFDHDGEMEGMAMNRKTMSSKFTGHENSDGVAFSADGVTWYRLLSLTDSFTGREFDLDAAVKSAGIRVHSRLSDQVPAVR